MAKKTEIQLIKRTGVIRTPAGRTVEIGVYHSWPDTGGMQVKISITNPFGNPLIEEGVSLFFDDRKVAEWTTNLPVEEEDPMPGLFPRVRQQTIMRLEFCGEKITFRVRPGENPWQMERKRGLIGPAKK